MENNNEQILKFVGKNAIFFETWSNWLIIFLFTLIVIILFLSITRIKTTVIKVSVSLFLLFPLCILLFITWLLNSSLKPLISSVATVQRTLSHQVPDFGFLNARDQKIYKLSDFRGKVVVLNSWGTTCSSCVEELADLRKLEEIQAGRVIVISLSEEPADTIVSFIRQHNCPSIAGGFMSAGWIDLQSLLPLTMIIDKDGVLREYMLGRNDFKVFSKKVEYYSGN
jgi:thiol-disulfide isomerase/thioredoxin